MQSAPATKAAMAFGGFQSPVAVTVPVDANLLTGRLDHLFKHELDQRDRAHGRGVSGGVAEDQSMRAALDGRRVELLHRFRIAAGRIFGDVHDFETERDCVLDGPFVV